MMKDDKKQIALFQFLEVQHCFSASFLVSVRDVHVHDIGMGMHAVKGGTRYGHCGYDISVNCVAYTAFDPLMVELIFHIRGKRQLATLQRKLQRGCPWIASGTLSIIQDDSPASVTLYSPVLKDLPVRFADGAQSLFNDSKTEPDSG